MDKLLLSVIEKATIGIIILDKDQKVIIWNNWLSNFFNVDDEFVLNKKIWEVFPKFSNPIYQNIISSVLNDGQKRICSSGLHRKLFENLELFGQTSRGQLNTQFEPISFMAESYVLIQIVDITTQHMKFSKMKDFIKNLENVYEEAKTAEKKNRMLAIHDPLTKLPNRLLFNERLQSAINLATRNNQIFALMFVDLDGFKYINDTFGHKVGDCVLEKLAANLKGALRKIDTVARIGGDEFAIILNQIAQEDDIHIVAKKIIKAVKKPMQIEEQEIVATASIGISIFPRDGDTLEVLMRKADEAMYKVKNDNKDGYGIT